MSEAMSDAMSDANINESGMSFIADNAFYIERSPQYAKIGKGVKSVELARVIDTRLMFIEAKTTFPNPNNANCKERYDEEISNIRDKFVHSLNLYSCIAVGIAEEHFPIDFKPAENMSLHFILVIKDHKPGWCRSVKNALMPIIPSYIKTIWNPTVLVMNHNTALEQKLSAYP